MVRNTPIPLPRTLPVSGTTLRPVPMWSFGRKVGVGSLTADGMTPWRGLYVQFFMTEYDVSGQECLLERERRQ